MVSLIMNSNYTSHLDYIRRPKKVLAKSNKYIAYSNILRVSVEFQKQGIESISIYP